MIENRVAYVTGASRGIGKAIALILASNGYKVIGTATSKEGADKKARQAEADRLKKTEAAQVSADKVRFFSNNLHDFSYCLVVF